MVGMIFAAVGTLVFVTSLCVMARIYWENE